MRSRGLRSSISHFKRHPWLHAVSIATISVALLLLGGFFLCYRNLENLAQKTNPHVTGTLYLKETLAEAKLKPLREAILSQESVSLVTFKNKTSVIAELQTFLGGSEADVIPGSELFPDLIEIELSPEASAETVAALKVRLSGMPEIGEVDFSEDWLAQYNHIVRIIKVVGILLMIAIVVGSSFIIANFMGMRHQSRREEIEIVRLMGAHHGFILTPFVLEGMFEGTVGAGVALALLYAAKVFLSAVANVQWTSLLGINHIVFISVWQFLTVVLVGIAMAFMGSFTVFLRFRENHAR